MANLFIKGGTEQTISVNEARKLLGLDARQMSDTQVTEIIESLTLIASKYLKKVPNNKLGV